MASGAASADRLILIDPASGKELSRLQTWLATGVMISGALFVALVVTAIAPIMHDISEHFGRGGHGRLVAYGMATLPSIGIMIGGPVTGWVIERVGPRNFMLAIFLLFGLTGSAGLYLDNVWLLVGTRFLLGVSAVGVVTGTLLMIGAYFAPEMRIRVLGYQGSVGAVGALLVILSSGQLADWAGWRAPFVLYFAAFVAMAATAVAIPPRPMRTERPVIKAIADDGGLWTAFAAVWLPLLVVTSLFIGSFMPTLQVSFLLAANGVLKASNQSFVLAASALMVGVGSAVYGPLRLRFDDRWMLRFCAFWVGSGIVVMGFSHGAVLVAIGCAISGIGTGLLNPQVNNMLLTRAAPTARGRTVGLGYTARYTGDFLNPVIIGPIAAATDLHSAFITVGATFVLVALVDLALRRMTPAVSA